MRASVAILLAAAAIAAPADAAVRDWPLRGFERVQLEVPAGVTVHAGRDFAIRTEGEPEAIDRLTVQVRGGTLFIAASRSQGWFRSGSDKLHVDVTLPRFSAAAEQAVVHGGHLALSVLAGAAYAASIDDEADGVVSGVAFGLAFYGVAHWIAGPLLGVKAPEWRAGRGTIAAHAANHVGFGLATAIASRWAMR